MSAGAFGLPVADFHLIVQIGLRAKRIFDAWYDWTDPMDAEALCETISGVHKRAPLDLAGWLAAENDNVFMHDVTIMRRWVDPVTFEVKNSRPLRFGGQVVR